MDLKKLLGKRNAELKKIANVYDGLSIDDLSDRDKQVVKLLHYFGLLIYNEQSQLYQLTGSTDAQWSV